MYARRAWLPVAITVLPTLTVATCYSLSAAGGYIPACNPLFEGCTSISSAGRHAAAYWLFKAGVIPTAALLAVFWPWCRGWFLSLGLADSFGLRAMVWLGMISAAFLVLYSVFLGSSGEVYQLLRRFGVTVHFSFSYLAQVLLLNRLWDARRAGLLPVAQHITTLMFAATLLLFALGLYSIPVGELIPDPDDVLINIIEWNFALLLISWYTLVAVAWRSSSPA
ncbi:MAG: hypothetical protein V2J12_09600 [Gammaproteobacteria bacterium]|jgi:hypothetical protein|nr:hypothetical protein [Gammaproteobacteria bacterium]